MLVRGEASTKDFASEHRMYNEKVLSYKKIDSTQDVAYRLALQGESEGTAVVSDYQTAGRGRLGKKWFAPPRKNILCSLILKPSIPPSDVFLIIRLAAYTIKKVIEEETGLFLQFKYPNDLLINKKKVAGLLAETRLKKKRLEFIILGIGININAKGNDLIEGATSLKRETEKSFSRAV
ncbi:MAG: biotin--[acetyl-CoA-carboxylase] ligase, partial [Candidatus Aminicenantes bacterium]